MLNMNVESIAEVKVLTQGYQAEYGRSSGIQITAVTKSGTNRFRGSAYDYKINSDWNENSWVNTKNGDPKPVNKRDIYGYSVGGPVGKPGGNNKLFFYYSHEYRPTNAAINGGNPIRLRVPTALERAGDFSQTLDNNGALFNTIRDHHDRPDLLGDQYRQAASRMVASSGGFRRTVCITPASQSSIAIRCRTSSRRLARPITTRWIHRRWRTSASSRPSGSTTSCPRSCASRASTRASERAG